MQTIQYSPNRSSRILDIEIQPMQQPSGTWSADCSVYETVAGVRVCRGTGLTLRDVPATCEDDMLDAAASRIADDIEHQRGITL
ncbi:hypothetical protein [Pigmentiphaga litoralis]|uniref:hypothetical protein n=1 Tax=Pigmentiphaga litoralis TaxID=516702 RepID=UPI003B433035